MIQPMLTYLFALFLNDVSMEMIMLQYVCCFERSLMDGPKT